jgi:hypothetical protein
MWVQSVEVEIFRNDILIEGSTPVSIRSSELRGKWLSVDAVMPETVGPWLAKDLSEEDGDAYMHTCLPSCYYTHMRGILARQRRSEDNGRSRERAPPSDSVSARRHIVAGKVLRNPNGKCFLNCPSLR